MLIVLILLTFNVQYTESTESTGVIATSNEYSSLRDSIMNKGIESLSSAIFNLGTGIDKNIVKLVSVLPRLTLYNYGTRKLDTRSAPKVITNFDISNQTAISMLVDYAEGIGAYGALGLICLGILLVEFCCFLGALFYSIGSCCCCKLGERDQKFRLDNYGAWAKDHEKRKRIICAFRIILLIWVILNIALLMYVIFINLILII
ncbi:predicted protein [Naegleria gruberi]|uniref:Predicted protein n=1 Tax=Naegleria gruberi TaxID=5762 RepID=D2VXN8_NAEGR|nr:uncharacterized protein NAEGRDRAFT_73815 [Naegleria gruberi]EFC38370.1 predicted protein [Naegleria gruberi]|eukprot:XP_002671114.1 predicted protein [Naegleria gruberi strain NEG-M]